MTVSGDVSAMKTAERGQERDAGCEGGLPRAGQSGKAFLIKIIPEPMLDTGE